MTATLVTNEQIEACGFRMFDLHEIARTMQMQEHPNGGEYIVLGNKRERMAQYGNAVTPPVMRLIMGRLLDVLGGGATFKDMFCGAGGSSIGAEMAGAELSLGLNHWKLAIETHATNFQNADHDCADVSALTTSQIRRYPDTDILLASPECTNHSLAKGALRRKPQSNTLFEDGPSTEDEQDRSRATMWDVVRFAEQKLLKGHPYKAIVVENVVDAYRWGAGDDGGLFTAWRQAIESLGYLSEIVWLNSMFAPPTPQSRDRMYVVYWRKGVKRPNLRVEPPSWCPSCEKLVLGRQSWKRPARPHETASGKPVGARYGVQYVYGCPDCNGVVLPGAFPAATAIDWTLPIGLIGDRAKPMAKNTLERIRRGLTRLQSEPFAIRLLQSGTPKPLTLPFVTLTARHDMAMVMPIAAGTFERTPGNRARDAETQPMWTVHGSANQALVLSPSGNSVARDPEVEPDFTLTTETRTSLVVAYTEDGVPRIADREPTQTQRTNPTLGLVELQRNGDVRDAETTPAGTMRAGGFHHGVIVSNYGPGGGRSKDDGAKGGWARDATVLPFGSITATDGHALVVPYGSEAHDSSEPAKTVTTLPRIGLLVPPKAEAA